MTSLTNSTSANSTLNLVDLTIKHDGQEQATPDQVSFELQPAEVTLLLGPSGSGKSTLALATNGLIPQVIETEFSGKVTIGNLDTSVNSVAEFSEQVTIVFQDPDSQIVTGTLLDEVSFGPENLGLPVEEVLSRSELALKQLGLWDRRELNPDRLSGGGKQRLAIACALALKPKVMVLDEPTANLDPVGIVEVYKALGELIQEGQQSVLLIEHNLDAAMEIVDRVIVLDRNGKLRFDGPAAEVIREHVAELVQLGVWLPTSTRAALAFAERGVNLEPLPITEAQLVEALAAQDQLPKPIERKKPKANTNELLLEVKDLSIEKQGNLILDQVNLKISTGEFISIVGTNGAGKTTLIQALAGVSIAPRDRISIAGLDPRTSSSSKISQQLGFVFQNPEHQFITHTVYDELAHGLRIRKYSEAEVSKRVEEMLDRFGLSKHRNNHPFLLSGGQKRRLSVGTALITGAPILVLDEPTFGQDQEKATELLKLLAELNQSGTTIVIVSHDLQLVVEYSQRVIVMQSGKILADDESEKIFADRELLERAGLKQPPLSNAFSQLSQHPQWQKVVHLDQIASQSVEEL